MRRSENDQHGGADMDSIAERECKICNNIKSISEFKRDIRYAGGHIWQCKSCRNNQNKILRKKTGKKYTNPEYRKKYYAEHAEEAKKKTIDWRNNNLEYSKKRDREYQLNNIDKISKRQKEWRESNKEHMKEYRIKNNLFPIPPLFKLIQEESKTDWKEMYQVFNCGHRMELYVDEKFANEIISISKSFNVDAQIIGYVEYADKKQVTINSEYGEFVY